VVLGLIRAAGGEWEGKKRLYKGFYFAHLYFAERNPGLLTDCPIARMPQGPGIHKGSDLLSRLAQAGLLEMEKSFDGPYPEVRFRLTDKGQQAVQLTEGAAQAVQQAADFCKGKTGSTLSQITHDNSRSWREANDGDILDIYVDLFPDEEEFEAEEARMQELNRALQQALAEERA